MGSFHFLRPEWLLALLAALLLAWIVTRREDVRARWRGVIAPHLLEHLVIDRRAGLRLRPLHLTVALIVLGALAAAGPTWEQERPPFVEDRAPLAIAIDLSQTMDAIDVTPTRLERVKLKIHDLLAHRPGTRTAVFAYAGSAHMVLPLTDDAALIRTYVDSLATGLMPLPGKNTAKALAEVEAGLAREQTPGTILFITDGVEPAAFGALTSYKGIHEIMVLGVGTAEGGPVRTGTDSFLTDATGRRVFSRLDVDGLKKLKSAGIRVATVTADDDDVQWIARRAQAHLQQKQDDTATRWKDAGWWLVIPIALFAVLWFRRGWTIRWASSFLIAAMLARPESAQAQNLLERAFFTPDQLGRMAYERGDFEAAAQRFSDPMWQGTALYRAGKYDEALQSFARVDTAESYFNQGNCLARSGNFAGAAASYQDALKGRPGWKEAAANLALVQGLLVAQKKKDKDEQGEEGPNLPPDQVQFDEQGKKGKRGKVDVGKQTADMWMRNIQTTPAQLLQRKFALQAREAKP